MPTEDIFTECMARGYSWTNRLLVRTYSSIMARVVLCSTA